MTTTTFCTNCGAAQRVGAIFCVSCGAPQGTPPIAQVEAPVVAVSAGAAEVTPPPSTPAPEATPTAAATPPSVALPARPPMAQLIATVVGASIGVGALAVALTLVLSRANGPGTVDPQTPPGNLEIVEVDFIRAEVPITWDVVTRSRDTIVVEDDSNRALWLRSGTLPGTMTLDSIQQRFLERSQNQSPDAKVCAGPETAAVPGGPADGRYFVICSTFIPQGGGRAVRLADAYLIGLDAGAVTVAVMQLTAAPESLEAFATEVRALPSPVWKLFR